MKPKCSGKMMALRKNEDDARWGRAILVCDATASGMEGQAVADANWQEVENPAKTSSPISPTGRLQAWTDYGTNRLTRSGHSLWQNLAGLRLAANLTETLKSSQPIQVMRPDSAPHHASLGKVQVCWQSSMRPAAGWLALNRVVTGQFRRNRSRKVIETLVVEFRLVRRKIGCRTVPETDFRRFLRVMIRDSDDSGQ